MVNPANANRIAGPSGVECNGLAAPGGVESRRCLSPTRSDGRASEEALLGRAGRGTLVAPRPAANLVARPTPDGRPFPIGGPCTSLPFVLSAGARSCGLASSPRVGPERRLALAPSRDPRPDAPARIRPTSAALRTIGEGSGRHIRHAPCRRRDRDRDTAPAFDSESRLGNPRRCRSPFRRSNHGGPAPNRSTADQTPTETMVASRRESCTRPRGARSEGSGGWRAASEEGGSCALATRRRPTRQGVK
jgi:hypothetical protein